MASDLPPVPAVQAGRWRVFLDANVLISGVLSPQGAPAAILDLGEAEEILIVINRQVLVETDRNFAKKFPELTERYRRFITNLAPFLLKDPSQQAVHEAAKIIHSKDAPILAAAHTAQIDYLVTGNTRHFATEAVRKHLAVPVVTPAEFLSAFRKAWEHLQ